MARWIVVCALAGLSGGCAMTSKLPEPVAESRSIHRDGDDLLSAGLGLEGLRASTPPAGADAAARRRWTYWTNWRGIGDLTPQGGFGEWYGSLDAVPGEEWRALLPLPGVAHGHSVLLHLPDHFDRQRPCLVVAPVSGSRGMYGALATVASWALPRGCAVVYTDKGAGTGYYDVDAGIGLDLDGAPAGSGALSFRPELTRTLPGSASAGPRVAVKHAHSQAHPEAKWGEYTLSAVRHALRVLHQRYGTAADGGDVDVIAASISNGGGAVLKAVEADREGLIDAAVAGASNITVRGAPSLLDYATRAALLAPCAQLDPRMQQAPMANLLALRAGEFMARCQNLAALGWLKSGDARAQAAEAYEALRDLGFRDEALQLSGLNIASDLWRAVAMGYANAYGRFSVLDDLCGFRYAALDAQGQPRAAGAQDHASWFASASGIPSSGGVHLIAPPGEAPDPAFAGLRCLRAAFEAEDAVGARIRRGEIENLASAELGARPVIVLHGRSDGLVPVGPTSRAYVEAALQRGASALHYWEIEHVQHFDAFLGQPMFGARLLPLVPFLHQALDQALAHLREGTAIAPSQVWRTQPRGLDEKGAMQPLQPQHLGALKAAPGADGIALMQGRLVVPE